jgi:hypothetical protein
MKVQQTTHPEENQLNVGWNLTFSIMKVLHLKISQTPFT